MGERVLTASGQSLTRNIYLQYPVYWNCLQIFAITKHTTTKSFDGYIVIIVDYIYYMYYIYIIYIVMNSP